MENVPIGAKIWLTQYETSGQLEVKNVEENDYGIMVMNGSGRLVLWRMRFDEEQKKLMFVELVGSSEKLPSGKA
jgi:hypothetical protein